MPFVEMIQGNAAVGVVDVAQKRSSSAHVYDMYMCDVSPAWVTWGGVVDMWRGCRAAPHRAVSWWWWRFCETPVVLAVIGSDRMDKATRHHGSGTGGGR